MNDKQNFDEIFRNEALRHYETGGKNSPSRSCCYGNRNSFFVFLMTNISARGQVIVLKFWQYVLLNERYNLYLEHNFLRLTDFPI